MKGVGGPEIEILGNGIPLSHFEGKCSKSSAAAA
jgi:hypothetical protein